MRYPLTGGHLIERMGGQSRVVRSSANIDETASDGLFWLHYKALSIGKRLRVIRFPNACSPPLFGTIPYLSRVSLFSLPGLMPSLYADFQVQKS